MTQLVPLLAFLVTLASGALLYLRDRRLRRALSVAQTAAQSSERAAMSIARTLRLFAQELQSLSLSLRGHVDLLAQQRHMNAAGLAVSTAQLQHLADELDRHLSPMTDGANIHVLAQDPVLSCEDVALPSLLREVTAQLTSAIAPGRRHFRLPDEAANPPLLWADRRALRLILARVLGEAVRSSAQHDWIDISWQISPQGLALRIADEGAGTVLLGLSSGLDSRGIGLRLSLAGRLVQAHGGTMQIEAQTSVGTCVTILLPAERLRQPVTPAIGARPIAPHIPVIAVE